MFRNVSVAKMGWTCCFQRAVGLHGSDGLKLMYVDGNSDTDVAAHGLFKCRSLTNTN